MTFDGKEYAKQHYKANKEYYLQKADRNRKRLRERNKAFVNEYLESHSCVDCGESDIEVLQFDHIDTRPKKRVSSLVSGGVSTNRIVEEIKKCKVRCANCHLRRTKRQRLAGW